MIILFAIGLLSLFILTSIPRTKEEEGSEILKTIVNIIIFGITCLLMVIGVNVISGNYAKTIKCKEYQIDKVENIKVINSDTIKTVHYVIHDIKR